MVKAVEKRNEVLYVKVKKTNKNYVKKIYKKLGFSTLSEYIDAVLDEIRDKKKWSDLEVYLMI